MREIQVPANIVDVEECRKVSQVRDDATGEILELRPVDGSEQAFLHLQLPGGQIIRAEVTQADFESHVRPLFDNT